MRTIPAALTSHLAGDATTLATCWKVTLRDDTVLGFTDHDRPITVAGVTYNAASGYRASDIDTAAALNVDNLELAGLLQSPSITEADLLAGKWDFATVEIFLVNWKSPTDGVIVQRTGRLGEVTVERGQFKSELRGLMQAYTSTLVELTSPTCRANLGDTRCGVNLAGYTVTGTLTGVGVDGVTLLDTSRTEPGPSGGVAITGITRANPGVVTLAGILDLAPGSPITISGVAGMVEVNGTTLFRNPGSGKTTFQLGVDTTDYGAYTSGGTVTPLGGGSSCFDRGVITFTSGANAGLSEEVKSYVPGQLTLALAMPYACAIGDAYSLVYGCDKSLPTCRDRFDNAVNFRGEPYLPGFDSVIQVGRRQ